MELSFPNVLLFLLSSMVCFGEMASFNNHFVDAKTLQSFNDFETEEIEEQLKVVNKPATKIIKTIYGDTYGCVDFYKQPAFDHPSMTNHSLYYEMRWTSSPNSKKFGYLWENGVGCPISTVPIRRVTKYELLRINSISENNRPQGSWNFSYKQSSVDGDQHHFALSRTKGGQGKIYNGASMIFSIHDLKVKLPQYSSVRMHLQMGDDFIQVGWTVNPELYSDSKTRVFVYTKTSENQCYNSICSAGIIMVRSDIPLGMVLSPPTIRGSDFIRTASYGLLKDKANGNWWLLAGEDEIGFWPANIFKQSFANNVEWGGEVYSAFMPSPQMGNGYFPVKFAFSDSVIINITTVNEKFVTDFWVKNTEAFSDNTRGYKVKDEIYPQFPSKHVIFLGGPGNI